MSTRDNKKNAIYKLPKTKTKIIYYMCVCVYTHTLCDLLVDTWNHAAHLFLNHVSLHEKKYKTIPAPSNNLRQDFWIEKPTLKVSGKTPSASNGCVCASMWIARLGRDTNAKGKRQSVTLPKIRKEMGTQVRGQKHQKSIAALCSALAASPVGTLRTPRSSPSMPLSSNPQEMCCVAIHRRQLASISNCLGSGAQNRFGYAENPKTPRKENSPYEKLDHASLTLQLPWWEKLTAWSYSSRMLAHNHGATFQQANVPVDCPGKT